MKTERKVAYKESNGKYRHFYPNFLCVSVSIGKAKLDSVYEVELTEDPNGEYWSWYENERDTFLFTFNHPMAIEICFPYGTKSEIEKGRGKVCRVSVKEIRKLDPKLDSKFSVTRDEKKDANKT